MLGARGAAGANLYKNPADSVRRVPRLDPWPAPWVSASSARPLAQAHTMTERFAAALGGFLLGPAIALAVVFACSVKW